MAGERLIVAEGRIYPPIQGGRGLLEAGDLEYQQWGEVNPKGIPFGEPATCPAIGSEETGVQQTTDETHYHEVFEIWHGHGD